MTPSVTGILETALYVDDMQRSVAFYRSLLDVRVLVASERITALAVREDQVLLIFRKGASIEPSEAPFGTVPAHDGDGNLHLALAIPDAQVPAWRQRLTSRGIAIESDFVWPEGGTSLYFRDPDGHSIELRSSDWSGRPFGARADPPGGPR